MQPQLFPSSVLSFLPFTFTMSQHQHRLAPSSSNSQRRPARNSSSSGGGSSSSGGSSGSSNNKRRHTNGSGIGKNRSRRAAVFDVMEEEDGENVDPRQAIVDLVEATSKQAVASSIPEAADAMLDAMNVMEWCPALRSTVLCRMAKDEGLMFASQSDIGKAKSEPENKKTAFKSAAFHLILPFMAYFRTTCLTTIDCKEHSLLKMVGYLWGEWDPERPITQTELSKEVAVFIAPMKSTTWRVTRAALRTNMLAMLKKVTHEYTGDDGSPEREITSAYIVDTMTTQMEKQPEAAMRGLGTAMFAKGLSPAKHGVPVAKGETMKTMSFDEVYSCPRSAPWNQILQPTMEVALQEMELYVFQDVINARRLTPGHKTSNKSDPDKYRTFPVVKEFLEKAFGGKTSAGDKYYVIRETFWDKFMEFGEEYLGDIPEPDSIRSAEDARRYLKPYLFEDKGGGGGSDEGEGGGSQENGGGGSQENRGGRSQENRGGRSQENGGGRSQENRGGGSQENGGGGGDEDGGESGDEDGGESGDEDGGESGDEDGGGGTDKDGDGGGSSSPDQNRGGNGDDAQSECSVEL